MIDINNLSELRAWAKHWGCSEENIRDAVHSFGVMVPDVRDWLRINVVRCARLPAHDFQIAEGNQAQSTCLLSPLLLSRRLVDRADEPFSGNARKRAEQ